LVFVQKETKKSIKNPVTAIAFIGFFGLPNDSKTCPKGGSRFRVLDNPENGKKKTSSSLFDERHGETNRRGASDKSSNFIFKNSRILVQV
jgi:hypothetical protein